RTNRRERHDRGHLHQRQHGLRADGRGHHSGGRFVAIVPAAPAEQRDRRPLVLWALYQRAGQYRLGQYAGHRQGGDGRRTRPDAHGVRSHPGGPVRRDRRPVYRHGAGQLHVLTHLACVGRAATCLALLLASAAPARAGSFMVTPIRATLSAAHPVSALTVRNDGAERTVVQVDALIWTQRDGGDVYAPTKDIIATPPIFSIAPGASQVVRVGLRRDPESGRELTYRLSLQEIPPPPKADFLGLRVALRLVIPVFVVPPSATAPRLQWRVAPAGPGALSVALRNEG